MVQGESWGIVMQRQTQDDVGLGQVGGKNLFNGE